MKEIIFLTKFQNNTNTNFTEKKNKKYKNKEYKIIKNNIINSQKVTNLIKKKLTK